MKYLIEVKGIEWDASGAGFAREFTSDYDGKVYDSLRSVASDAVNIDPTDYVDDLLRDFSGVAGDIIVDIRDADSDDFITAARVYVEFRDDGTPRITRRI